MAHAGDPGPSQAGKKAVRKAGNGYDGYQGFKAALVKEARKKRQDKDVFCQAGVKAMAQKMMKTW